MRRRWQALLALAALVALVVTLAALLGPHRCFLDVLNAQIVRSSTFQPFYAGAPGLPAVREVVPELGALEDAFETLQGEALAVFEEHSAARRRGEEGVPRMDAAFNGIFDPLGCAGLFEARPSDERPGHAKQAGGPLRRGLHRAVVAPALRAVYGKDVDIFTEIGSDSWRTFNLVLYGREVPGNAARCPEMVRRLRRVPGMQSALLSILAPGAYIPPHSDPAKGVIRYHLAFKVPRDRAGCFIEVAGQRYHWATGRGVLFDDAYEHWAQNATGEHRVILFVDILRPLAGAPARALQAAANFANRHHPGVRRLIRLSEMGSPPGEDRRRHPPGALLRRTKPPTAPN